MALVLEINMIIPTNENAVPLLMKTLNPGSSEITFTAAVTFVKELIVCTFRLESATILVGADSSLQNRETYIQKAG